MLFRSRGLAVGTPLTDSDEFRGGWYYPGEVAALDARDYLYIEGRASDVIMRGGAKIYPSEIEAALREHAGVADVAVIGTRAADNEETIVAFVTARGGLLDVGTLRAHCRGRLTPYKIPSVFHIVAELPRNTGGKVDRADRKSTRLNSSH